MLARLKGLLQTFQDAVDDLDRESQEWRRDHLGKFDFGFAGTIVLACVCIATIEYFGGSSDYKYLKPLVGFFVDDPTKFLADIFRSGPRSELFRLMYWAGSTFMFYFLVPATFLKLSGKSLREHGLSLTGTIKLAWVYVALYLTVLFFVVAAATTESFQKTYPFYDNAHASLADLFMWEAIYLIQFFSLEFFYRGFIIQSLRNRFGFYAIFVSVIPYCMIHFGKPYPETIGAIIAGLALGTLALFTRNIWLGAAVHISVALTMDTLSLLVQGKYPTNLFP